MENYSTLSDEQLALLVRTRDRETFRYLVERYQQKLMRYVNYLIHNETKSADVVQETFILAYRNLNGFDVHKKFSSWIYRIAHNQAMNSVKKHARELPLDPKLPIISPQDPVENYSQQEIARQVRSCLGKIPLRYSEPLSLFYLEEKSYAEISDILRIPLGTVSIRISRAKSFMKNICQK